MSQSKILVKLKKKLVKILDQKIRPAVAKDGGDIKFKEFQRWNCKSSITRKLFRLSKFNNDSKTRCSKSFVPLYTGS